MLDFISAEKLDTVTVVGGGKDHTRDSNLALPRLQMLRAVCAALERRVVVYAGPSDCSKCTMPRMLFPTEKARNAGSRRTHSREFALCKRKYRRKHTAANPLYRDTSPPRLQVVYPGCYSLFLCGRHAPKVLRPSWILLYTVHEGRTGSNERACGFASKYHYARQTRFAGVTPVLPLFDIVP